MWDDYDGGRQVGEYLRNQYCLKVLFVADNRLGVLMEGKNV